MSIRDLLREALRALEANRGRSLLTILGIVIGISAVIAMTSLIGGVQNNLLGSLGLNAARIVNMNCGQNLTTKDLEKVSRLVPDLEALEGSNFGYIQVKSGDKSVSVSITGGSPRYFEITGQDKLVAGRMPTEQEDAASARVVVLPRQGARLLLGLDPDAAVGRSVSLNGRDYQVIGVAEDASGSGGEEYTTAVMPFETVARDFNYGEEFLGSVIGLAREGADVDEVAEKCVAAIAEVKDIPDEDVDEWVWAYTMKSSIDSLNQYMGSFSLIMGAVAGISLLVGGIGIMNMMLTNVTERIREIGVRRALGARRADITRQFLAESATLCVTGGVLGIVVGYLLSWGLVAVAGSMGILSSIGGDASQALAPELSPATVLAAVGTSILIGVVFGYYPARRAARLDPVECLRYQ